MKKRYKRTHSGWMRRTSRIYLKDANSSKVEELKNFLNQFQKFVEIEPFNGLFETCLKFGSGVPKLIIPFNWTKHTNKFKDAGWELSKSVRLGYNRKGLFVDLIFEKERPKLNLDNINVISLENLKNVKRGNRGKFSRRVNRLLSFWLYAKVDKRLAQICEEKGIRIILKSPWKTSQRCSVCGNIDRRNRKGERFLCLSCGYETNADYNASKNLELLGLAGVYSLRSLPSEVNICL